MLKFVNNLEPDCSAVQEYLTFSYFIEISKFRQGSRGWQLPVVNPTPNPEGGILRL